jgi:hypothetical protein
MSVLARIAMLVFAAVAIGGCIHASGGIIASTTPMRGSYDVIGPAQGRVCMDALFGVIPFSRVPRTEAALKKAMASQPGADALVDVTVDSSWENYLVVTSNCIAVSGTAVKFFEAPRKVAGDGRWRDR